MAISATLQQTWNRSADEEHAIVAVQNLPTVRQLQHRMEENVMGPPTFYVRQSQVLKCRQLRTRRKDMLPSAFSNAAVRQVQTAQAWACCQGSIC